MLKTSSYAPMWSIKSNSKNLNYIMESSYARVINKPNNKYRDVTTFPLEHKIAYSFLRVFSLFYRTTNSLEESVSPKNDTNLRMSSQEFVYLWCKVLYSIKNMRRLIYKFSQSTPIIYKYWNCACNTYYHFYVPKPVPWVREFFKY